MVEFVLNEPASDGCEVVSGCEDNESVVAGEDAKTFTASEDWLVVDGAIHPSSAVSVDDSIEIYGYGFPLK